MATPQHQNTMNPTWVLARDHTKPHTCTFEGCNAAFDRPYRLQQHLLVHANVRAFPCPEEDCSKAYTTKSHLHRHISTFHKSNQRDLILYSCPTCLKHFSNLQNLKRHINTVHLSDRVRFSCAICNIEFNKKHQLNTHMYRHTGIKAFNCDDCSESFVTPLERKKHMKNHKTYSCTDCCQQFNHWSTYQKHRKAAHIPKEYICDLCDRVFKHRTYILHHMKTHDPRKSRNPENVFICPYNDCNRQYTMQKNLKQHIKINHDKITHECTICQAKLCTKATLNQHMKLHEGPAKKRTQKTLATGRKVRKDKGTVRPVPHETAIRISGITPEFLQSALLIEMVESPEDNAETTDTSQHTENTETKGEESPGIPDRNEMVEMIEVEIAC